MNKKSIFKTKVNKKMLRCKQKKGISLIVLVITIIVRYDEWLKTSIIGKVPPKNKMETMRILT